MYLGLNDETEIGYLFIEYNIHILELEKGYNWNIR